MLDGWRELVTGYGQTARVRAFPPRLVHILAGNAPGVSVLSIMRGALVKGVHLLKLPSNDLFTATAVLRVVRRIPPGRVATYGDVATMAGRPRAARAVGNIMRECGARDVPCHRVVGAGGALGGYGGNDEMKRALLRAEGVTVVGHRVRKFAGHVR